MSDNIENKVTIDETVSAPVAQSSAEKADLAMAMAVEAKHEVLTLIERFERLIGTDGATLWTETRDELARLRADIARLRHPMGL